MLELLNYTIEQNNQSLLTKLLDSYNFNIQMDVFTKIFSIDKHNLLNMYLNKGLLKEENSNIIIDLVLQTRDLTKIKILFLKDIENSHKIFILEEILSYPNNFEIYKELIDLDYNFFKINFNEIIKIIFKKHCYDIFKFTFNIFVPILEFNSLSFLLDNLDSKSTEILNFLYEENKLNIEIILLKLIDFNLKNININNKFINYILNDFSLSYFNLFTEIIICFKKLLFFENFTSDILNNKIKLNENNIYFLKYLFKKYNLDENKFKINVLLEKYNLNFERLINFIENDKTIHLIDFNNTKLKLENLYLSHLNNLENSFDKKNLNDKIKKFIEDDVNSENSKNYLNEVLTKCKINDDLIDFFVKSNIINNNNFEFFKESIPQDNWTKYLNKLKKSFESSELNFEEINKSEYFKQFLFRNCNLNANISHFRSLTDYIDDEHKFSIDSNKQFQCSLCYDDDLNENIIKLCDKEHYYCLDCFLGSSNPKCLVCNSNENNLYIININKDKFPRGMVYSP